MPYDAHNPLTVSLPYNFINTNDYPTEVMANRFSAWRSIIKELLNYFKEYVSVQEEIVRQQNRLQSSVGAAARGFNGTPNNQASATNHNNSHSDLELISKSFLPVGNGSVQDISNVLFKYHQQNVTNASKTLKDINVIIIPKLEELRKDLLVKIKEIKNLQNDFKNNLGKELNETKSLISQYNQAIEMANKLDSNHTLHHSEGEHGKYDPYLVKLKLDRQLKKQLIEENYLYDAYSNLQNAGKQLEGIVVVEIQNYMSMFLNLIREENSTFANYLVPNISEGFLSKESNFEWNAFIERNLPSNNLSVSAVGNQTTSSVKNGTFIDLDIPKRHSHDLIIRHFHSNLNVAVREGYLERRSKFLKNYSSAWYVLTCSYIHEFKSNDRKKDPHPVMSLPLDSCTVSDHSKDDGKTEGVYKFILTSKSASALMHKTHKWVFRTNTYSNMIDWFNDIKKLTSLPTPSARARTLPNSTDSDRVSRNSSVRSPQRSLRTVNSNTPSNLNRTNTKTTTNRPLSQTTSIANAKRLSSTFSQKNNHSPRLANMINSDGTLITPVDSYDELKRNPTNLSSHYVPQAQSTFRAQSPVMQIPQHQQLRAQSPALQYRTQGQLPHSQQSQPQFHLIPVDSMTSNGQLKQSYGSTPTNNNAYFGQQPQQFYDPVQQQYYTITPSLPPQQTPQPQAFSSSPQPNPQFLSTSPVTQPFGSAYFTQANYNDKEPIHTGAPYSTTEHSQNTIPENENGRENNSKDPTIQISTNNNGPDLNKNLHPIVPRQSSADEVSTLKSNPIDKLGDIDVIVTSNA
ncbi:uncharacterized protein KGF55_002904 [Candida pseudojiufengensis]|uniref:uncharacterized protein n=1 Tax=Candida pseudojiufengensis TaxID=497109 RepID=UPI0022245811|nr:uncharacterized protein KGF55_002904 [Candida pseudojiufengensis]KAI5963112.1 hypothetical protein KGF55_002904 [Candida pseudojiufengensis]